MGRVLPAQRYSDYGDFALFAIAFIVLSMFLVPISWTPALNADSGTALSISKALSEGDTEPLVDGLFPPFQTVVYSIMVIVGIVNFATAVPVLFSALLAIALAGVAHWYSRSYAVAAIPPLFLLFSSTFWQQTGSLTFYPAFALLGYSGLFFAGRYVLETKRTPTFALLGAVLLAASLYAFTTALLFLPIPAILLAFFFNKQRMHRTLVLYAGLAVTALPWFAWHIAVGGSHFYYHPLNWLVEKHLAVINDEFWNLPHESLTEYAPTMLNVGFEGLVATPIWLLVPVGAGFIWRQHGARAGLFVMACVAFFLASLAVIRPAPYDRYFYPVLPLTIALATAGTIAISRIMPDVLKRASIAGIVFVAVAYALTVNSEASEFTNVINLDNIQKSRSYNEMLKVADLIDDSKGIISRDSRIQSVLPDNRVSTVFLIDEADYVTYLTWPSDSEVQEMLGKYDIGWLLLYKDAGRWERDYNVWLERNYGLKPRHYIEASRSTEFRKVMDGRVYVLYQVLPRGE